MFENRNVCMVHRGIGISSVCRQWKTCRVLNRVISQWLCGGTEEENGQKMQGLLGRLRRTWPSNITFSDPLHVVYAKNIIMLGCTLALNFCFRAFLRHKCDNFGVLM